MMKTFKDTDVAKFSFVIFLIAIVFNLNIPFREETIVDVEQQIGTSNIFTQVIYSIVFIMSFFVIFKKIDKVILIIKKEKYLSIFLLWCIFSILWSHNHATSFKRLFQIITMVTASLAVLMYSETENNIIKYFATIFFIYIISSMLSIAFYPRGAIDIYGSWRGIAVHKNHFGQIVLASIILWTVMIKSDFKYKFLNLLMLLFSIILILGSRSSTSIATLIVLILILSIYSLVRIFDKIGVGRFFLIMTILSFFGIVMLIYFLAPDLIYSGPKIFGKDLTFSGRTELWGDVFTEVKKHLLFGYGYGGFWQIDNQDLISIYDKYQWIPLQGHNGYLDILNETGLVGILLLLCMVISYFKKVFLRGQAHFGTWFIIAALIINLQESVIFNRGKLLAMLFIFSYLAVYTEPDLMIASGTVESASAKTHTNKQ